MSLPKKLITVTLTVFVIAIIFFPPLRKIDRSPYQQNSSYHLMQQNIDKTKKGGIEAGHGFNVGYSKENITPNHPIPTAGYGNRWGADFTSVRDSIYVRTMVVDNGIQRVALVSVDILIFPPKVTSILSKKLPGIGFSLDDTYLSATHSHNSLGNWGERLAGRIVSGAYDDSVVNSIANAIIKSIGTASRNALPAKLKAGNLPVSRAVRNRLLKKGDIDSLFRIIEIIRNDSSRLVLTSFTAHPTCLDQNDLELSRDYPGKLVDNLEKRGYSFAMFMAGAMGSMSARTPRGGETCINWIAEELTHVLVTKRNLLIPVHGSVLVMRNVPLALPKPQLKISEDWRLSPWWFRNLFGEYPAALTVLRMGDIVMIGTPCDFSGELSGGIDKAAAKLGLRSMITSFNGGYIGYITKDERYDLDHSETRLMNWYGPGNGQYLSESINQLIINISR